VADRAPLLDAINVFPVADGDTGINMSATVASLRRIDPDRPWQDVRRDLLMSARGNSGNLTARFLGGLVEALVGQGTGLADAVRLGRDQAYGAVTDPIQGTILTLLDALADHHETDAALEGVESCADLLAALGRVVERTPDHLPVLREAGVVDSGALGLLFFLEGFFAGIHGEEVWEEDSWDALSVSSSWLSGQLSATGGRYCVDLAVQRRDATLKDRADIEAMGSSVEVLEEGSLLKVHLHTDDPDAVRRWGRDLGEEVAWHAEDMEAQLADFRQVHGLDTADEGGPWSRPSTAVHVVTDAAGSTPSTQASELGMSLHHSYIHLGGEMVPECEVDPDELYRRLAEDGERITTAQAAELEIFERLDAVCRTHAAVLYVAVGHQYTGNTEAALRWKAEHDAGDRLRVLDTGAASGQLALVARACAERAAGGGDPAALLAYAQQCAETCREYIFLGTLKYLARSGRMSRVGAFFGNALRIKPVIVHRPDGAGKEAVVRSREAGLDYAVKRAVEYFAEGGGTARMLLQYTDAACRAWVEQTAAPALAEAVPEAEQLFAPMSSTSGTHMGPGTWAVAFIRR